MIARFCGNCGAPAQEGQAFCVFCGSRISIPGAAVEPAPAYPATPLPASPPTPVPAYSQLPPWTPSPPKAKKYRTAVIAIVVVVILVIVIAVVALVTTKPSAEFVSITKTGISGTSMTFDVTIHTRGQSVAVDRLHVNIESIRGGSVYDGVQFYNIDPIPADTTFTWNVDVYIDVIDVSAFTYRFGLEVNGVETDSSTVT